MEVLKRLGLICLIPFFFALIIIYFAVSYIGMIIVDPFVWIITGRTFFLAFVEDRLWNKGELLGEKADYPI